MQVPAKAGLLLAQCCDDERPDFSPCRHRRVPRRAGGVLEKDGRFRVERPRPDAAAAGPRDVFGHRGQRRRGGGISAPCLPFTPCTDGTGYVPVVTRQLRADGHTVTLLNMGIPGAVLSRATQDLGNKYGLGINANFIQDEAQFTLKDSTLVTIFAGRQRRQHDRHRDRAGRDDQRERDQLHRRADPPVCQRLQAAGLDRPRPRAERAARHSEPAEPGGTAVHRRANTDREAVDPAAVGRASRGSAPTRSPARARS